MSFLFPSLLWIGLPLIAVPVLIHLINLRRQQRIRWAAMQFLMVSQRQNRRWILFKQLLLLAVRMAAVAVLVLMLAHLMVRNEWLRLLGSGTTHHILLIDDSYSTTDRWENTSAFEEAKRSIQSIVDQAYRQSDTQLITLLRFSEAARLSAGAQPEVFAQRIDDSFRSKLPAMLAGWEASQTDVGPADALKAVPRLPLTGDQQSHILYLVSDFRTRQFGSATEVRKLLDDMGQQIDQIHLVRCVQQTHPNLAITALAPESGVRAAGVETWMNVTVANYGGAPRRVVSSYNFSRMGMRFPALPLEDIPPHQEMSKKFRVQFTGVGAHSLSAAIGADSVDVDNRRFFSCLLLAAQPVLIIDGSQDGRGGRQISLALDPGGNTHTGWSPHIEPASYLTRPDEMAKQVAVCLLDVPRLTDDELTALENYVRGGGGAAFFVGSQTNRDFYNERLYHNGAGVFPVPLTIPTQLVHSQHETAPDVSVGDHPLFHVLAGRRNGFLPLLSVDYYYATAADWSPPSDGSTNVIARLRNEAPLVAEKKFGNGRVVAQLTRLSTGDTPLGRWTNWSLNPVFPVLANELMGYLSADRKNDAVYQVGDDLVVSLPDAQYEPTVRFFLPGPGGTKTSLTVDATSDHGVLTAKLPHVAASGVYEAQLQPHEGAPERRAFAVNVPVGEGDLQTVEREDLSRQLAGVNYQFHDASDMAIDQQQFAGLQLGDALLGALIVVLLLEQILAYVASFHVQPVRGRLMGCASVANLLLAQAGSAAGRVVYELSRLHDCDDDRLPIALLAIVVAVVALLVTFLYRRDTIELPRGLRMTLAGLRFVALAGLLVFFLGIERRTTHEVVHNSQVAVLVDVSQSMALNESDAGAGAKTVSRLDEVVTTLAQSPLIEQLRRDHDVHVARFDKEVQPVVSLPKTENEAQSPTSPALQPSSNADKLIHRTATSAEHPEVDWSAELTASGTETRLGDALDEQFRLYRNAPLAGVVVISDGAQNAGIEPNATVEAAKLAKVPIFTIGVGSSRPRRNLAVSDLLVPSRAFPGDLVTITGYLQATGYAGQFVDVELRRRGADEAGGAGTSIASQRVALGADGEIVPVTFEIKPDEPKRYVFQFRAAAPPDDDNPRDNQRESEMDVVDRKTRVLLFASGPTRDYRFLRDQLHRDASMKVDVLLQTAQPGISQDANDILPGFPTTKEDLYQYDCIVAFDPDWTTLDATQVALLESWVADEAGGMIVVPGPIHSSKWIRSTEHAKLLDLYPVVFQQRLTLLDDGHFRGDSAWPLEFDRAGRDARFLWLANTAEESEAAWSSFPGVYGYYAIKGEKPGATVYARVADPESGLGDQHPVYMASQFYGAGQVLYIGSGEFWRLRALDTSYFEVLYTKLIRHVSQGRLLRGSSLGALLVDRDRYELGETVVLRARLSNARHEPLTQDKVVAQVMRPDTTADTMKLQADAQHAGMYLGQFTARQEGTYQVVLPVPDSNEEPFSKYIQVRVPDLERAHPERNELLLRGLAKETGGQYYAELTDAVHGKGDQKSLPHSIESRAEVKSLKGAPDTEFAQLQMRSLLGVIAGALFIEWILRRLNRLA